MATNNAINLNGPMVSFMATNNADQLNVTGDNTVYNALFPDVIYNIGSGFDPMTSIFTAPISGKYMISCSYTIEGIDNTHISGSCVLSGTTNYIFDISNFYAQSVVASGLLYRSYSMIIPLAVTEFILPVITVNGANKTIDITTGVGSRSPIFSGFLIATV